MKELRVVSLCCRLLKSIYGLKAPGPGLIGFELLWLLEGILEVSLITLSFLFDKMIPSVYVDDIIITGNNSVEISSLKHFIIILR